MNIRQAQLSDINAVLEIANSLRLDIPEFVWNRESFVAGQINGKEYFVAESDGKIMGIISLRQRTGKIRLF